ncbi:hypothetical protein NS303_21260 [Pantoea ananatis]|nr:hypothetical protein NS303_21260 [Pantoea ananatis]KTR56029.1 hypothetical protein NS311_09405 [Pantoea ananatis]KTR69675.1 hypothetical protein NS296_13720 [Pantoea ananatis]
MLQLCATRLNVTLVAHLETPFLINISKRHKSCCKKLANVATPFNFKGEIIAKVQLYCERAQPVSIKKGLRGETDVTDVLNALCAPCLYGRIPRLKGNRLLLMR